MLLVDLKEGQEAEVTELAAGWEARKRLMDLGIHAGTRLTLLAVHPMGGPLLVKVGGSHVALGRGIARKLSVELDAKDARHVE